MINTKYDFDTVVNVKCRIKEIRVTKAGTKYVLVIPNKVFGYIDEEELLDTEEGVSLNLNTKDYVGSTFNIVPAYGRYCACDEFESQESYNTLNPRDKEK